MRLPYTPAQERFREEVRAWLLDEAPGVLPTDYDQRFQVLRDWQRRLYDAGWLGWGWAIDHGGRGGTVVEQLIVYQEIARARAPMPVGLVALEVVGPTIAHFATPEQARRFLKPLLRGDEIWSQGFSEPDAGSDLASLSTRAELEDGGFVLTGHKVWTTQVQHARWCAVLARTDPAAPRHEGISCLLVDLTSPGVTVRPLLQPTGDPEFGEVYFDAVRVPRENLLGPLHEGWKVAMTTLAFERAPAMLRRLAEIRTAFDGMLEEMRERLPARELELVAERVGESAALLAAMEARGYRIVDRIQAGERTAEDSIDKLFLTRVEQTVFGLAYEVLGASRLHEYLFGRAASIYGGTSEIQRNILAERWLGLARA
ncbi:MAG TPA: acyl-CoA dehydrogenase family protein [Candidatus Dormibacteraeota bacterium]